jgi:hypothetical protein
MGGNCPNDRKEECKMKWKESGLNQYSDIVLSDCHITNIEVINGEVVLSFSEWGFFKKDTKSGEYYRTEGAQIAIQGCDFDSISIQEIRAQRISEEVHFKSMYDVDEKKFLNNINTGRWRLEIVEEFNSIGRGFYTARIHQEEESFWCYIKLYFKDLVYSWGDIRYDRPW